MGSDLPEPNVYHIFFKDVGGVAATLLQGEDTLLYGARDSVDTPTAWTLTYVDREEGICMISDTKSGHFLGIKEDSVDVDRSIYLSQDRQTWIIKEVDDGASFIVGRTMADGQFGGWTLPRTGASVEIGIFDWIQETAKEVQDGLEQMAKEVAKGAKVVFKKIGEGAVAPGMQVPIG